MEGSGRSSLRLSHPGFDPQPFNMTYYNEARTHLSLNEDAPVPRQLQNVGCIFAKPHLGGLHHQLCSDLIYGKHRMGSFYRSQHELVFVFKNGKGAHVNNVDSRVQARGCSVRKASILRRAERNLPRATAVCAVRRATEGSWPGRSRNERSTAGMWILPSGFIAIRA